MIAPVLLGLAFLVLLCVLAVVSLRLFGARNDEGRLTAPGCLGGCAMAAVLAFLGLAGLAAFVVALAVGTPSEEFRDSLDDVAREVSSAVREGAEEVRRELHDEFGDGRTSRRRSESRAEPASSEAPAPTTWRARVVLSWPGESDPPLALLAALEEAGLRAPIDVALSSASDETDGARTRATVSASTSAANIESLRKAIEEAAARLGGEAGLELSVLEVVDEDLR